MKTIFRAQLKMLGFAALAASMLAGSAPIAQAQSTVNSQVVLNPGTVIPVKLDTELSSNQSQSGDTFTARVDDSRQAYRSIMQGATVDGVVKQVTAQSGDQPGTLTLAFNRLHLSDGRVINISGEPTSLDTKNLSTDTNGVLIAKNTKKNNALTYAGIGAGAGALVSILSGGKLKIEDVLLGGGLGYAASVLLKGQQQVHDVDLKSGTQMGVLLDSRTRYYHRTTAHKVILKHKKAVRHY